MPGLLDDFRRNWSQLNIEGGRKVLLALSGGLDSMCLASLLLRSGIPFDAAHCNFGLRGDESDGDEYSIRAWAATKGVGLLVRRFDTTSEAGGSRQSIQMTARRLRYDWFEQLRKEHGYAAILTAHHADDVAETVLINLIRGTGLTGLQGVPLRNGYVLRPLLFAGRAELAAYGHQEKLEWREDSSNASDKYLRNAIRLQVMPLLERMQPGAGSRIAQTANRISGALPVYNAALETIMNRLIERRGRDLYVPVRLLRKQQSPDNLIFELFSRYGFSSQQMPAIRELMDAPSGKQLLSPGFRLFRDRDFLILTEMQPAGSDLVRIDSPGSRVSVMAGELHFRVTSVPDEIPTDPDIALLDMRDIRFPLNLRPRRAGDYFYPLGMGGKKKKLKRFLVDVKMPVPEKERLLILEQDGKVIWVVGSRIDERFRVRPDTREVLEIRFARAY